MSDKTLHNIADRFLADIGKRVDELGKTMRAFGGAPADARTVATQTFLAVLRDLHGEMPDAVFVGNLAAFAVECCAQQNRQPPTQVN